MQTERFYVDYQLRTDSIKEDEFDCWFPVVDSFTNWCVVVANADTAERAELIAEAFNAN